MTQYGRWFGAGHQAGWILGVGLVAMALPHAAHSSPAKPRRAASRLESVERALAGQEARIEALAAQEARVEGQTRQLAERAQVLAFQTSELQYLRAIYGAKTPVTDSTATVDMGAPAAAGPERPTDAMAAAPVPAAPVPPARLAGIRAGQAANPSDVPPPAPSQTSTPSQPPVGEAPPADRNVRAVAALPEQVGVLTPKGQWVFTPSLDYVNTASNRLVFHGVEIVPGIQLGVIEANTAQSNSLVGTADLRYGVTSRLEVEALVPYVYRRDRVTLLEQQAQGIDNTKYLSGHDIGDIEVAARYQLNEIRPGQPIYVASVRIKPPTGQGPYDVHYDSAGVATDLATGSGFWGTEGGLTLLYPSDPAVIFASLTYLHNWARDENKTIGQAVIGRVEPGDSIGASAGFGLSLNPRFSVSLGYSHYYIAGTRTQVGGIWQRANSLQVGTLLLGWSVRLSDRMTLSNNFQFGVTSDAPNVQAMVSLPVTF